jgi:hypothetical protein
LWFSSLQREKISPSGLAHKDHLAACPIQGRQAVRRHVPGTGTVKPDIGSRDDNVSVVELVIALPTDKLLGRELLDYHSTE